MPRILLAAALVLTAASGRAAGDDARTTRLETAPVNGGARITIEEGVRVFRPLPSEQHVIVNPEGRTPLSLDYYAPGTGVPVLMQPRR